MESVAYEGLKLEKNLGGGTWYPIDCMHVHSTHVVPLRAY